MKRTKDWRSEAKIDYIERDICIRYSVGLPKVSEGSNQIKH